MYRERDMLIYLHLYVSIYLSYWFPWVKEETKMEIIKWFELNEKIFVRYG